MPTQVSLSLRSYSSCTSRRQGAIRNVSEKKPVVGDCYLMSAAEVPALQSRG